jgi:predicted alpha/beta-hydrolase family hydrolase
MNWITIAVVGAVAAWFEYNYQRSRRRKAGTPEPGKSPVTDAVQVANPGVEPSIVPGDQNDKQMNTAV